MYDFNKHTLAIDYLIKIVLKTMNYDIWLILFVNTKAQYIKRKS